MTSRFGINNLGIVRSLQVVPEFAVVTFKNQKWKMERVTNGWCFKATTNGEWRAGTLLSGSWQTPRDLIVQTISGTPSIEVFTFDTEEEMQEWLGGDGMMDVRKRRPDL